MHLNRFCSSEKGDTLSSVMHDEQEGCPLICTASYATDDIATAAWNTRTGGSE